MGKLLADIKNLIKTYEESIEYAYLSDHADLPTVRIAEKELKVLKRTYKKLSRYRRLREAYADLI